MTVLMLWAALLSGQETAEQSMARRLEGITDQDTRRRVLAESGQPGSNKLLFALSVRAGALVEDHRFEEAESLYRFALELAVQASSNYGQALILTNLAGLYRQQNRYPEALELQERGLEFARRYGDGWMLSNALVGRSTIQMRLADLGGAERSAREAMEVAEKSDRLPSVVYARSALISVLRGRGDYRAALALQLRNLDAYRQLQDRKGEAVMLGNIAGTYGSQGSLELAVRYYLESMPLAREVGYTITEARFTAQLADVYQTLGDDAKAREHATRAAELARGLKQREILASADDILSDLDWRAGRRAESLVRVEEALALLRETGNREALPYVLARLGGRLLEMRQRARGLKMLEEGCLVARESGSASAIYVACSEAGIALRREGRAVEARVLLEEAILSAETIRDRVGGGAGTSQHYFSDKDTPYKEMVLIHAAREPAEAFQYAERGRTRALLEALSTGNVDVEQVLGVGERARERELRERLNELNVGLAKARAAGTATKELERSLEQARVDWDGFETVLYAAHPELRARRLDVKPARLDEVPALLAGRGALLEYVVTERETIVFVLRNGAAPEVVRLSVGASALRREVDALAAALAGRAVNYRAAAALLGRRLLEPLRSRLDGVGTLVIVPDGPLWRLPFGVLELHGEPLLLRYSITYAPSATVLRELRARARPTVGGSVVAAGNPGLERLPGVDGMLEALGRLYGAKRTRLLRGAAATESSFRREVAAAEIVQVASHGVLDNRKPLYSYLALAPGEGEDGFLEARELAALRLKARVVVLAACESAAGGVSGGEGVVGLTWAILLAGGRSVVASPWKVDAAATSSLMASFHRSLLKGIAPAAALRDAALALRKDPRFAHPFYWAAFAAYGDGL